MGIENNFTREERRLPQTRSIMEEMKKSYMDYAMSVIVSRALPDVRDGMKPVHRRILYGMWEKSNVASKAYRKCAKTVGDVIGTYHPHGDQAVYEAMVRLTQSWVQREPLIDGQGNFGNRDGDPAAAYRYTEARLFRLTEFLLTDLEKGTVNFAPNYDGSEMEPRVLPARWPNLIVNGQQGIAVGMATSIPSHNLGEAIDACLLMLDKADVTVDEIMEVMPGPDFGTSGFILGQGGIRKAYETGRGSIRVAGKWEIVEPKKGNTRIVVTELPWGSNAVKVVMSIKDMIKAVDKAKKEKKPYDQVLDSIADVVDETAEDLRFYIEIKKDGDPNIVLNYLKKKTDLVSTFPVNMTVLNTQGNPEVMGILQMIREFVAFRRQTVRLRTIHELNDARKALNLAIGLYAAVSQVDVVVSTIRSSKEFDEALARLMGIGFPTAGELKDLLFAADPDFEVDVAYQLTESQARHVLNMALRKLTGLETEEIAENARGLVKRIEYFNSILNDRSILDGIVRNEMLEIKQRFATPRLTVIEPFDAEDIDDEDLIEDRDIVVTFSSSGAIKRTELTAYREQKRGGKGRNGMETKDDDYIQAALHCSTKTPLLIVTSRGISHSLKAYRLPDKAPAAKGNYIGNFINLMPGETVTNILAMPTDAADLEDLSVLFVTDYGKTRRNSASEFAKINKSGKIAIKLEDENGNATGNLVKVLLARNDDDVVITTAAGNACRFQVSDLRVMNSRTSDGVKVIALKDTIEGMSDGDRVIDACVVKTFDASALEREAYLAGGSVKGSVTDSEDRSLTLSAERMAEMQAGEEFLLTISAFGFGKRSSAFSYRRTSRGAAGVTAAKVNDQTGPLVACFPVEDNDGLVLVTDGGQLIRTRASEVRVTQRPARGVKMFSVPDGQKIVSVVRITAEDAALTGADEA